jgi:methylenetetrahydrofolate reductase (NADPH)
MRGGRYLSGRKLDPPPHLFLGAVENPQAPPVDYRVDRASKKVRAGARFLQLQVSFELDRLEAFLREGPGMADVTDLTIERLEGTGDFDRFEAR